MGVCPRHDALQNIVQAAQFDVRRDDDPAPDGRPGIPERDFQLIQRDAGSGFSESEHDRVCRPKSWPFIPVHKRLSIRSRTLAAHGDEADWTAPHFLQMRGHPHGIDQK